jgi:2',3'-cyclic-nucleotide 2'-phosphodiesterase (5'-nucleotidase family)
VGGIDLILGGHDHFYYAGVEKGIAVVKSGSDFKDFTHVTLYFDVSSEEASEAELRLMVDSKYRYKCAYNPLTGIFTKIRRV